MPSSFHRRSHTLQRLLLLGLIAVVSTGCLDLEDEAVTPKRTPVPASKPRPTSTRPVAEATDQTWLIMLYEDADDEILEEDMMNDLNEAELVGSSDQVRIVSQIDRYDGAYEGDGDWTTAKRFLIQQDDDLEELHSEELADLGEVNMADADTLIDFVTWAAETYPSDKYVLIMSDHGTGWPGGWSDPEPATSGRDDISLAESFGDMLFLMEIGDALKQVLAQTEIGQFELIGFDACLMSSIEVYSAVAPYARYAVASQEVEPSLGWAYAAFLRQLVDDPSMDGAQLSRAIVDSYIEQDEQIVDDEARAKYVERMYEYSEETSAAEVVSEELREVTLTSADLTTMPALLDALDELVTALAAVEQKPVAAARRYAQAFETVFDEEQPKPYIDLGSFARLLQNKVEDPAVNTAATKLLAAIDATVIDEKHGEGRAGATGISIHFPNSKLYKDADAGAESYTTVAAAFAQQSLWDDYLAFHYTKQPLPAASEQPAPAAPAADAVEAPGADPITIAPITLSADTATIQAPLVMQSTVTGENIAFIYVFIGRLDKKTGAIQVMDMDFLDAEKTKEVNGVFYPDWGDSGTIEIEFEWDARVFALDTGETSAIALFNPDDYGASPDEAIYTVEGTYTTAKGKKSRRATLVFNNGELIQVLGYSGSDGGSIREITPKRGDRFTIGEQWMTDNTQSNAEAELFTTEGETLVFGEDNFAWKTVAAPRGEYLVGFIAEDLDGNWYQANEIVTRK